MDIESDLPLGSQIDRALDSSKWLVPLPPALRAGFAHERDRLRQQRNRRVLLVCCIIFNLGSLENFLAAPDIAMSTLLWRLLVLDPLVVAFLLLDYARKIGRYYDRMLLACAMLPSFINALVIAQTSSPMHLSNLNVNPMIMLVTGLGLRMVPVCGVTNAVASVIMFVIAMHLNPLVPTADQTTLLMKQIAAAFGVIMVTIEFEMRDRQIFLLRSADRLRRAELTMQNRGLRIEALTDALTGLPNRRGFDTELAEIWAMAQASDGFVALIMIDVDRFKAYNDFYGHQAGDECLRQVVDTARRSLRMHDLMARYGGEEFAVILPATGLDDATALAQRMCDGIAAAAIAHLGVDGSAVVTASFGVACRMAGEYLSVEDLISSADMALYQAKRSGRNQVIAAMPPDADPAVSRSRAAAMHSSETSFYAP